MKEIRIVAWCDGNHEEGEQVRAEQQVSMTIGKMLKPRTVDLCDDCFKTMIVPVETMLTAFGVVEDTAKAYKPKAPKGEPAQQENVPPCPECGEQMKSRPGLGVHLSRKHGKRGLIDYPDL
jgi:hypothetical protein